MSKCPYFNEPKESENTDYEWKDSIFQNDKYKKFFITSLLAQLNSVQTLPSCISANSTNSS